MNRTVHSENAPRSFSNYSEAVEVPSGARTLHVSGQVGVLADGTLVDGAEGQIEAAWQNVFALLAAANMSIEDIVDVLVLLKDRSAVHVFRGARDRLLAGHKACSTMMICVLAHPSWLVEIAVKAAKADR